MAIVSLKTGRLGQCGRYAYVILALKWLFINTHTHTHTHTHTQTHAHTHIHTHTGQEQDGVTTVGGMVRAAQPS